MKASNPWYDGSPNSARAHLSDEMMRKRLHRRETKSSQLLRQRTRYTSTLQIPGQLSHRAMAGCQRMALQAGVIKVRPLAQHLTSRYRQLMWDMKEHHPLVRVKNLDDHYSSVSNATQLLHKSKPSRDMIENSTNAALSVHFLVAIKNGLRVVLTCAENTSARIMA